ncbi:hypothetical protein [uncultured Roseibium sp.]|uniref:hypothetical protein n=1 Tax=uncultured Roseibium sp. TaxID=1936171 RepID=UPI002612F0CF|nr:hypothetical protein [uncultured Roseibium sp.]
MRNLSKIVEQQLPNITAETACRIAEIYSDAQPLTDRELRAERIKTLRSDAHLLRYGKSVCRKLFGFENFEMIPPSDFSQFRDETGLEVSRHLMFGALEPQAQSA